MDIMLIEADFAGPTCHDGTLQRKISSRRWIGAAIVAAGLLIGLSHLWTWLVASG